MEPLPSDSSAGDDFERVVLPHLEAVARLARALTRNRDAANDLVQETFLRAYRGWHTFAHGSDARPWLFTICRHVYVRLYRSNAQAVESEDGDVDSIPAVMQHVAMVGAGLGDLFERLDVRDAVRRAVDELPEPHHSILVLVDVEERSYAEAAAILEVPVGTVRSRLFRARRMVQEALIVHAEDMGLGAPRARGAPSVLVTVPLGIPASAVAHSSHPITTEVPHHG